MGIIIIVILFLFKFICKDFLLPLKTPEKPSSKSNTEAQIAGFLTGVFFLGFLLKIGDGVLFLVCYFLGDGCLFLMGLIIGVYLG